MYRIEFHEPDTAEWKAWLQQCREEQDRHNARIQANGTSEVKSDVYKGRRYNIKDSIYFDAAGPFHGKCAYCEKKITSSQHGDIDHFRPKSGVSDLDFNSVRIQIDGNEVDHPGYYWLCYDWRNLLPSCILCNQKSTTSTGNVIGKHTRFPVRSFRACRENEENREEPLLIHPAFEDPEEHLEIDSTGVVSARNDSDRGHACIKIFGLNSRDLPNERKERYNIVRIKMGLLFRAVGQGDSCRDEAKGLKLEMQALKEGAGEFTGVAMKAMKDARSGLKAEMDDA